MDNLAIRNGRVVVTSPERLQRLDKVRLGNGSVMIVTAYLPNRPANCYAGVLENGQGKEYVFGPRHRPTKIGVVTEGHPALLNNQTRRAERGGSPGPDAGTQAILRQLVAAIESDDHATAKTLAAVVKSVIG